MLSFSSLSLFLSLSLLLSLFPLPSLTFSNAEGTWTYIEGSAYGPLYLCLGADNSSILTGSYSEYGYIRGVFTKSSRTVSGKWFEVGLLYQQGLPTSGFFTWKFDSTYSSFTGSYYYDGETPDQARDWNETRIDDVSPSDIQCFRYTSTSSSLNGEWEWEGGKMYLSQNGVGTISSFYNSSLSSPETYAYSEGACDSTYQMCHGQVLQTDYYGQIMFVLASSSSLYVTAFEGSWDDNNLNIPSQLNGNHPLYTTSIVTPTVTEAEAAQNQLILFQGSFIDTPVQTSFSYFSLSTDVGNSLEVEGYAFESTVVRGTYEWSSRTFSGLWFDPGLLYPLDTYTTGTFTFTMSDDWGSFSGYYSNYREGEVLPYINNTWGPFYRSSFVLPPPSASLSDLSQPETPISGYYVGDWTLYICAVDGTFNASFYIEGNAAAGYATGRCGPLYKVCNGDFISSSQRGQLLITVLSDSSIQIDYYYATYLELPEPSLRNSVILTAGSHDPSRAQCAMNLYLPFVGNFSDPEYGKYFYISYDPVQKLLNGFYSELGVVRGIVNGESGKWEARWAEPGVLFEDTSNPTSGYAFFELITLDSFSGYFYFDNNFQTSFPWGVVNRYSYSTPSNSLAWVGTAYGRTLDGVYFSSDNDQIWFCEYAGESDPNLLHPYYMSFSWNQSDTIITGYSEGACAGYTRVCHGDWFDNDGNSGVLITSLADVNNLRISVFTGGMVANISTQIGDPSLHQIKSYTRSKVSASDEQCHQFDSGTALMVSAMYLFGLLLVSLQW